MITQIMKIIVVLFPRQILNYSYRKQIFFVIATSQLLHVYPAQYGQYFPRFSYFAVISVKYEKLKKWWSYCTRNRAITNGNDNNNNNNDNNNNKHSDNNKNNKIQRHIQDAHNNQHEASCDIT